MQVQIPPHPPLASTLLLSGEQSHVARRRASDATMNKTIAGRKKKKIRTAHVDALGFHVLGAPLISHTYYSLVLESESIKN